MIGVANRFALILLIASLPALADDTISSLSAGGLVPVRSTAVRMVSEDLSISEQRVTIVFKFVNETDEDLDTIVAFPLPLVDGGLAHNHPVGFQGSNAINFVDFEVRQDGKPIRVQTQLRAWKGNKEITARLRSLGLPLSSLDDKRFASAMAKLPKSTREQLVKDEIVVEESSGPWPFWDSDIQFYWRQVFPAHKTVELRQSYRPVVGGYYWDPESSEGPEIDKQYCPTPQTVEAVRRIKPIPTKDGISNLWARQIDYVLRTGANWKGPIGTFKVTVETGADEVLVTCFPGLRRVAPKRFEVTRQNFTPAEDLHLLVVSPREPRVQSLP